MSALGSLVVKLALEHAEYTQGLNKSEQAALGFAKRIQTSFDEASGSVNEFLVDSAKNVAGVVAGFAGINAVVERTQKSIDILANINDAVEKTGSSAEDLSRIEQATRAVGESFIPVEQGITRLAKGLASFDDGSNEVFRALNAIGVSARDTTGQLRTSAEVFIDVTKALQSYEDGANKVALVNALFGKSGAELIPVLNDISSGVDKFTGVSAQSAQRANAFNDAMAEMGLLVDNVYTGFAAELLPTLVNVVTTINANTTAFTSFQVVGSGVGAVLKGIAIAGFTVVDTFKRLGNEIGGRAAQLAAFASLDFEGAKFIGNAIAEDSAKAKVEYEKFVNTILNGDKAISQTVSNGGLKKTLDFVSKVPAETTKAIAATKAQVSETQRFIDSLNKEAAQLGKTTFEIKRMEAAKLGVLDAAGPLINRIEKETAAAKRLESQLARVKSITESVQTADERFAETQKELNQLLNMPQGGLSMETYSRALQKARDELSKTKTTAKDSFDSISQFAIQSQRNIQDAFSDGLFRAFDGDLKGMVDGFKRAIQQMLAQAISADLLGALFGKSQGLGQTGVLIDAFKNVLSGGSSVGGSANSASSLLGGITNLGGIFKDGFSSFKNLFTSSGPRGAFTGASFLGLGQSGSALANGVGAGAGGAGGLLSGIGGTFAGAGIGIGIGSLLGGDKKVGGLSSGLLSTGGAALGAFGGPIGAAIGGILGGAIAGLFGRGPLKQKETNLIGSFTADDFKGITSTKFKAQGGLVVGDKVERIKIDTDTGKTIDEFTGKLDKFAQEMSKASKEIGLFLDSSIKGISSSFREISNNLGLSTSAIDNFSASINIATEKGKGFTEEQLAEEIGKISDKMALELMPSLEDIGKAGESASDTLRRINNEFNALQSVGVALGATLQQTKDFLSGVSFEARNAFVELSGGIEALVSKTSFFNDNFLSPTERLAPVIETVTKKLNELGVGFVDTNEEFKKLVQSQDLTTEAGQKMYNQLLDIAPLFKQITDATGNLGTTIELVTQQINKATEEQIRIVTRRAELEARDRKKLAQSTELKAQQEAQDQLRESAISLRDALLRAGDAGALLSNEFTVKNPSINKDANLATEIAKANASLSVDLINELSSIALEVNDVQTVIAKLGRSVTSPQVIAPIAAEIRESILNGVDGFSSAVKDGNKSGNTALTAISKSINGLVNNLANTRARNPLDRLGQGIAEVLGSRNQLRSARATDSIDGKVQFGSDVIAYAKAISSLNKEYDKGTISAEQQAQALEGLRRAMGSNADLLNDTAGQMDRIKKASLDLAKSGLNSIGFYFGQISKKAKELNQEAVELQTPLGKASEAIGRFKSAAFVFGESVKAIRDGLEDFQPTTLSQLSRAGGQVSKASIVSEAAGIASRLINTRSGSEAQQRISSDAIFTGKNARDLSLLIDGIEAFDAESLERSFTRISNALVKNQINEAQFAKLFNIALDSFEGLGDGADNAIDGLTLLGRSAKNVADSLLIDRKFTTLNPQQQLKEAERQFNDVITRAKSGDKSAAGQLDDAAKTLLDTGQIALSNQTDLFTFVQARLREVNTDGQRERLEVNASILKQLETMNKRLDDQQKINTQITAQVASINLRSVETLERWEKIGMPATRT